MTDLINMPRIRLAIAGVALIVFALGSSPDAAHGIGVEQGQSPSAKANTSAGSIQSVAIGARLMLRDGWQVQTSSGQPADRR